MDVNASKGISSFPAMPATPPANLPRKGDGEIPANDNLKHDNVQVSIKSMAPDFHDTPSGSKTKINYLA